MKGWLLDTNVLSELKKPNPAVNVLKFVAGRPPGTLFVSEVAFAEIRFGIEKLPEVGRRWSLENWLEYQIRPRFAGYTLKLSEDVLVRWRSMLETCRKVGQMQSEPDLLIAATAVHHGLIVATRDAGFRRMGFVSTVDPWQHSETS